MRVTAAHDGRSRHSIQLRYEPRNDSAKVLRLAVILARHCTAQGVRKKPGPPRTTGPGEQVKLRCHADFLLAVDEWRGRQNGDKVSRPRAIMQLAWLALLDARK